MDFGATVHETGTSSKWLLAILENVFHRLLLAHPFFKCKVMSSTLFGVGTISNPYGHLIQ